MVEEMQRVLNNLEGMTLIEGRDVVKEVLDKAIKCEEKTQEFYDLEEQMKWVYLSILEQIEYYSK